MGESSRREKKNPGNTQECRNACVSSNFGFIYFDFVCYTAYLGLDFALDSFLSLLSSKEACWVIRVRQSKCGCIVSGKISSLQSEMLQSGCTACLPTHFSLRLICHCFWQRKEQSFSLTDHVTTVATEEFWIQDIFEKREIIQGSEAP